MILKINDRIRTRTVEYFNNFNISLKYDAVASPFSFGFYFDPDNNEHKELACIGHYHICTVEHNGELLVTGNMLSEDFDSSPVRKLVDIAGYSLTGVFEDCQIPTDLYPLQSDSLSIKEIAQKITNRFGIKMVVDSSVSAAMDTVLTSSTASVSQTVKSYLAELCTQKNIIISHNAQGQLLFTRAKTNLPVIAHFNNSDTGRLVTVNGKNISTNMRLMFNGQAMHSHITVVKEANADGGNAGETTIRNPYVINSVFRPRTITQSSGDDNDTEQVAKNALAAELKNIKLTITTDRWEIDGKIIKPNTLITVTNPEVYLYKKSTWFIESVDLAGDSRQTVATLNCVLPEVYNGQTPEYLFKGINLH